MDSSVAEPKSRHGTRSLRLVPLQVLAPSQGSQLSVLKRAFPGLDVNAKVSLAALSPDYAGNAWCSYALKDPKRHHLIAVVEPCAEGAMQGADAERVAQLRAVLERQGVPVLTWPEQRLFRATRLRRMLKAEFSRLRAPQRAQLPMTLFQRRVMWGLLTAAAVLALYAVRELGPHPPAWFQAKPMPRLSLGLLNTTECAGLSPSDALVGAALAEALEDLYRHRCIASERPKYASQPTDQEFLAWFEFARTRMVPQEQCRSFVVAVDRLEVVAHSAGVEDEAVERFDNARLHGCQVSPWQAAPPR